jgi:site-specific DNA recombinase
MYTSYMESPQVRAIVGARVSHFQNEGKTSHTDQNNVGIKYCDREGWEVVDSFEDLDVSAIKTSPWERPDLRPWLTDHEKIDSWDAIVFTKTDRVFRSAKDCVNLATWCKENKKILVVVEDGIALDYFNPAEEKDAFAQALSEIFLLLAAVFAEIEGRRFVQRAQARVRALRSTTRWGQGPPPYTHLTVPHVDGKGFGLALNPVTVAIVREIAETKIFCDDPWSMNSVAIWLNDAKIPTPQDQRRIDQGKEPKGHQWTGHVVRHIFSSPATQGIKLRGRKAALDGQGRPIRVGPAVFEPEEWDRIQQYVASRRAAERGNTQRNENPLLGVGRCGVCGYSVRQQIQKKDNGRTYWYFLCGRSPGQCTGVSIKGEDAIEIVEQTFLEKCGDEHVLRRIFVPGEDHSYELAEVEKTIKGLRDDRALGLYSGDDDEAEFREQMQALIARRNALKALPTRRSGWAYEKTEERYSERWAVSGPVERRKMLTDAKVRFLIWGGNRWEVQVPEDMIAEMRKAMA